MNRHLALRSGNPALNKNTFAQLAQASESTMTIGGTVNKTALSLLFPIAFKTSDRKSTRLNSSHT